MPRRPKIDFIDHPALFSDDELPPLPAIERAAQAMSAAQAAKPQVKPDEPLTFLSFGSGSSGNCAYIGDSTGGFLVDAGVDAEKVISTLGRYGIKPAMIHGIIVTHDHSDHVRFAYALLRKHRHMQLFATPRALSGMLRRHNISRRIKDYHHPIYKEHPFSVGNFEITAFEVNHDGADNAGFFIAHAGGKHHFAVATDLGCISERADHYMRRANYLMIEANYDMTMLLTGPYPEYLKRRIVADNGHLDNSVTGRYLREIYSPQLRYVFLCHLSQDNNTPEKALNAVRRGLTDGGAQAVGDATGTPEMRDCPVQLAVLPRFDTSLLYTLEAPK